jgi:Na+-driven multidrug efflux pump
VLGIHFEYGLSGVWSALAMERLLATIVYCQIWQRRRWADNRF